MRRQSIKNLWRAGGLVFGFCILAGAPRASAMSYHDNTVDMPVSATGYTNVTATYTITDFSITTGQDPDGNIYNGLAKTYTGNKGSMTYKIGRSTSSTVATWWKNRISASRTTFNHDPGELYFAFIGTLKITLKGGKLGTNQDTYTIPDVGIAMGSDVGRNNWWFGGKSCVYQTSKTNTVKCTGTSTSKYPVDFYFRRGGSGNSVNEVNLNSIVYPAYKLFPLDAYYKGESTSCKWQPATKCPPYVIYYENSTSQRDALKLSVNSNYLYNVRSTKFDTAGADKSHSGVAAIFVMSADGNIYASNQNKTLLFHHSSILAGESVASAGELMVSQGVITKMTNCSGHYQPSSVAYDQLKEALTRLGYTRSFTFESCSPDALKDIERMKAGEDAAPQSH